MTKEKRIVQMRQVYVAPCAEIIPIALDNCVLTSSNGDGLVPDYEEIIQFEP